MTSIYADIQSADSVFAAKIQTTSLITRNIAYGAVGNLGTSNDYEDNKTLYTSSDDNKLFLLSYEEINYGHRINATSLPFGDNATVYSGAGYVATTGTATIRTSENNVLFTDRVSRRANIIGTTTATSSGSWWLRSPSYNTESGTAPGVPANIGSYVNTTVTNSTGLRPACWLNL